MLPPAIWLRTRRALSRCVWMLGWLCVHRILRRIQRQSWFGTLRGPYRSVAGPVA